MRKRLWCGMLAAFVCIGMLCGAVTPAAAAENTSDSYTYDAEGNSQGTPAPYQNKAVIWGADAFGGVALKNPRDFFVDDDHNIYIIDGGNNRIVMLDKDYRFVKAITLTFHQQEVDISEATGIFVNRKHLYIADKKQAAVFVTDHQGNVEFTIDAPPADKVEQGFVYAPARVVVGTDDVIYIISANTYNGALQYDADGTFLGFFGSDTVLPTLTVRLNQIWRKILSDEAAAGLQRSVPISFAQFDIDSKNFLYTISSGTKTETGQVRRVNPSSVNVLLDENGEVATYGDLESWFNSQTNLDVVTNFIDVTIDDLGFFTLLDATRSRLFQYDSNTNLLYAFGVKGTQQGTFNNPVAVENQGDCILVLDAGLGGIHVLQPTVFGQGVRTAITLYNDGRYEDAAEYWERILSQDAYYALANIGMGKVHERTGNYEMAMQYYRAGSDRDGYSSAFLARREAFTRENFLLILIGVILLLSLVVAYVVYADRHPINHYEIRISRKQMPMWCLRHPFRGFQEMRQENLHSMTATGIIMAVWFLVSVMSSQLTAFHFNPAADEDLNIFVVLAKTVGLYGLFVLCNWAVSTLADGRGKLSEIAAYTAYALLPYIVTQVVLMVLSNFFSLEEAAFYNVIQVVGLMCTAAYLLIALREVHDYSLKNTLLTLGGTFLGMYFVFLIITIVYSMFAQLIGFLVMLYSELRLR